jgi:tetratricopeptide (TPR) repeat protein
MAVDQPSTQNHSPQPSHAATVRGLYTPAMLAELLSVPVALIRRWQRRELLRASQCVRRLPYFDFTEVAVARRLAQLYRAGCSLRTIDRKLLELTRLMPNAERPLADPAVVVEGRRLYRRRGEDLAEPGGQLLLEFDSSERDSDAEHLPHVIPIAGAVHRAGPLGAATAAANGTATEAIVERLQQEAQDCEDEGLLDRAAEAYRTILMVVGPRADIHFALADVLYRAGDLSAARERYYAALEQEEEFIEARASLGCVLAETGELDLAAATFQGALDYHPDFADVHFHLANVLERLQRHEEAAGHFNVFLQLAPESPWAASARSHLARFKPVTN